MCTTEFAVYPTVYLIFNAYHNLTTVFVALPLWVSCKLFLALFSCCSE